MKEEQVREIVRVTLRNVDRFSHLTEEDVDIRGFEVFKSDWQVMDFLQHRIAMAERHKLPKAS